MGIPSRGRVEGALVGLVVGDALGVPVEFKDRAVLARDPVTGMRGYGTHGQPPGTFSDDGSLALASAESLLEGYDPVAMMGRFLAWHDQGTWGAHGEVFDIGMTTKAALRRFARGEPPERWGSDSERENGNGSLMRILPVALAAAGEGPEVVIERCSAASALTHAHPRSRLCCALYGLVAAGILAGGTVSASLAKASATLAPAVPEAERRILADLLSGAVLHRTMDEIRSTGYVVHTLEAALWCMSRCLGFERCVLEAVNLGDDTDTVGAVTGGLAGLFYGLDAIPRAWIDALARRDEVLALARRFADRYA